jgi:hypothetical protein
MMVPSHFVSSHHPLPRQPGSSADVGPFVNVVTWILLITSALVVLTRLITKRALKRSLDVDDAFVLLALVRDLKCHCSKYVNVFLLIGLE